MINLIEIIWRDACTKINADIDPDTLISTDYRPGYLNRDVGYFIGIKEDFVIIALERCEGREEKDVGYRGTTEIPIGDIVKIYRLRREEMLWPKTEQKRKSNETQSSTATTDSIGTSLNSSRRLLTMPKVSMEPLSNTPTGGLKKKKAR
jgi:hypothetical protein